MGPSGNFFARLLNRTAGWRDEYELPVTCPIIRGIFMRNLTQSPSLAPGIQIGSRPATEGTLRLSANLAPECKRPLLLQEFFERLGVRYDAEPVDHDPVEIDLTIQALPGLQLMSGRM